jgi:hypothetical protein
LRLPTAIPSQSAGEIRSQTSDGEIVSAGRQPERWLEDCDPQFAQLGFPDDAARKLLVAEFVPTEDARGYLGVLRRIVRRLGVPVSF